MSIRLHRTATVRKDGKTFEVVFIENPLIDDVVIVEAKIQAFLKASSTTDSTRRVDRTVRDFLVRLGVER